MKLFCLVTAMVSLFVFESGLFGQTVYSTMDSTITYEFTNPTDSVLKWKELQLSLDSTSMFKMIQKFEWDTESGLWVPESSDSTVTDLSGLYRTELLRSWDAGANRWMLETRINRSYLDSLGKETLIERWQWDAQANHWMGLFRIEYEFDAYSNPLGSIECEWVSETEVWQCDPYGSFNLVYDSAGFLVEQSHLSWVDDHWVNYRKYEYERNELGWMLNRIVYKWDQDLSEWDPYVKSELYYDDEGRDTLYYGYLWKQDTAYWHHDYSFSSEYDESGKLTSTLRRLQTPDLRWQLQRYDYYFNEHGMQVRTEVYNSNPGSEVLKLYQTSQLYPGAQEHKLYGSLCRGDSLLWQDHYYKESCQLYESFTAVTGVDSIHLLDLSVYEQPEAFAIADPLVGELICQGQTVYYTAPENPSLNYLWMCDQGEVHSEVPNDTLEVLWNGDGPGGLTAWAISEQGCSSDTASIMVDIAICDGVKAQHAHGILLYPVPVRDMLQIQSDYEDLKIEVLGVSGCKVLEMTGQSVDCSSLKPGVYILRLTDGNGVLLGMRKIVKE